MVCRESLRNMFLLLCKESWESPAIIYRLIVLLVLELCDIPKAFSETVDIDGGGWTLVRHVPEGKQWHRATDQLRGSDVYGIPCGETCHQEWSVNFASINYNQFLFATGDGDKWLIAAKAVVIGSFYENKARLICKSSTKASNYKAKWYRRKENREDPWISLTDHHTAIEEGNIIYAENNLTHKHMTSILQDHRGANVFIRTHGHRGHWRKHHDKGFITPLFCVFMVVAILVCINRFYKNRRSRGIPRTINITARFRSSKAVSRVPRNNMDNTRVINTEALKPVSVIANFSSIDHQPPTYDSCVPRGSDISQLQPVLDNPAYVCDLPDYLPPPPSYYSVFPVYLASTEQSNNSNNSNVGSGTVQSTNLPS